ncbi:hypothetical protein [Lacticaseibacillus sp. N501-2]|uniref:hypothetical protein n=1 Tax=Lacticaseibacillus salsurae TaxID=3367729 RepID=UPI0038B31972
MISFDFKREDAGGLQAFVPVLQSGKLIGELVYTPGVGGPAYFNDYRKCKGRFDIGFNDLHDAVTSLPKIMHKQRWRRINRLVYRQGLKEAFE